MTHHQSWSQEWIVLDEAVSEDGGEAQQEEEEEKRSPKHITEARTVKLTESAVDPPVIPDVKVPDPQLVSRFHGLTHSTHTGKYHCPIICSVGLHGHVTHHVLRSHLPWFWIGSLSCWECG